MADSLSMSCRQPRAQRRSTLVERWRDGRSRMRRRDEERSNVSLCPPQDTLCFLLQLPSSSFSLCHLWVFSYHSSSSHLPSSLPQLWSFTFPTPPFLTFPLSDHCIIIVNMLFFYLYIYTFTFYCSLKRLNFSINSEYVEFKQFDKKWSPLNMLTITFSSTILMQ